MKHGDPYIRDMISRILDAVNRPVTTMLQRWIYEGELEDPDGEFFVASDTDDASTLVLLLSVRGTPSVSSSFGSKLPHLC